MTRQLCGLRACVVYRLIGEASGGERSSAPDGEVWCRRLSSVVRSWRQQLSHICNTGSLEDGPRGRQRGIAARRFCWVGGYWAREVTMRVRVGRRPTQRARLSLVECRRHRAIWPSAGVPEASELDVPLSWMYRVHAAARTLFRHPEFGECSAPAEGIACYRPVPFERRRQDQRGVMPATEPLRA